MNNYKSNSRLSKLTFISLFFCLIACEKPSFLVGDDASIEGDGNLELSRCELEPVSFEGVICENSNFKSTMTDERDGKSYKTVQIGAQIWMAENLNYGVMLNDNSYNPPIQSQGYKFCYENLESNCEDLGALYQWHSALNITSDCVSKDCSSFYLNSKHQGICPEGWYIPKSSDWSELVNVVGGISLAGKQLKTESWGGTNKYSFNGIPTGFRQISLGYTGLETLGYFWQMEENNQTLGYHQVLNLSNQSLTQGTGNKTQGASVRCLKDTTYEEFNSQNLRSSSSVFLGLSSPTINLSSLVNKFGTVTDYRDSKSYKTVSINGKTWLAENLNYGEFIASDLFSMQTQGQKFCFLNNEANCSTLGGLYQWHTFANKSSDCSDLICQQESLVLVSQGICMAGWHIPTRAEWSSLESYLGGQSAGSKMKLNNTGYTAWNTSTYNDGNSSGFSALGAGFWDGLESNFSSYGGVAYFWETEEGNSVDAYSRYLTSDISSIGAQLAGKTNGFSVRCIQD
jgi:uncharacterized protein (TIGR02145 family)